MTITVNYELTDYLKIAALVHDKAPDTSANYEVEYEANGYTLILDIEHEIEYREDRGGSYEGRDWERISVVDRDEYDVIGFNCFDSTGNEMRCDFHRKQLNDILN
jgi:hypothetical protein